MLGRSSSRVAGLKVLMSVAALVVVCGVLMTRFSTSSESLPHEGMLKEDLPPRLSASDAPSETVSNQVTEKVVRAYRQNAGTTEKGQEFRGETSEIRKVYKTEDEWRSLREEWDRV